MHCILAHFKAAGGYASCIDGFAGCIEHFALQEGVYGFGRASHVAYLAYAEAAIGDKCLGILAVKFVLGGAGQGDVALDFPWLATWDELGAGELVGVWLADVVAAGAELEHVVYLLVVEAGFVEYVAVGAADGDDLCTELGGFLGCAPGDVAEAAYGDALAGEGVSVGGEHLLYEVEAAVACGFGSYEGAAVFEAFACEDAREVAGEFLILTEEVSYLACSDADITGGYVDFGSYVAE